MNKLLQIVLSACLFIAILFFLQFFQESLIYSKEAVNAGELWRLWTGHLVHINYKHLLLNCIGLGIFIVLYNKALSLKMLIIESCILASSISIGLYYLSANIFLYAGLSGLLYGLFTLYSIKAIKLKDYLLGYCVFFLISLKIIWSYIDPAINVKSSLLIQAPIANDVHLYGYITAIVIATVMMIMDY